jgi:hypothetical protein
MMAGGYRPMEFGTRPPSESRWADSLARRPPADEGSYRFRGFRPFAFGEGEVSVWSDVRPWPLAVVAFG